MPLRTMTCTPRLDPRPRHLPRQHHYEDDATLHTDYLPKLQHGLWIMDYGRYGRDPMHEDGIYPISGQRPRTAKTREKEERVHRLCSTPLTRVYDGQTN